MKYIKYYNDLMENDRYADILSENNNPLIAGFLYSKLSFIENNCIEVEYSIEADKISDNVMISDVIKILGILIDNAIEEIKQSHYTHKCMEIKVQGDGKLKLEVGNVCKYIENEEVINFFCKESPNKEDKELALYCVKEIVKKWEGKIHIENRNKMGENWFYIIIELCANKRL